MMREVLHTNSDSYYKKTQNIGEKGDFTTAPEISQLFGEMLALWAIEKWQQSGNPKQFTLLELGPGQGQLMQDFLRVARLVPEFYDAAKIYLLEINPYFIKKQRLSLEQYHKDIKWISDITEVPKDPLIVIANEFFDALPIKQYIKVKERWFESVFIVDPIDGCIKYSKIAIKELLQKQLLLDHPDSKDGAVVEESLESLDMVRKISKHIKSHGGAVLVIDYGYDIDIKNRIRGQYNSTLQAVKNHKYSSIIGTLGEADITAHVDFNALKRAAYEQGVHDTVTSSQREFLLKYGIELRLRELQNKATSEEADILERQVFRLISEKQMGELFKVLEIVF